MEKNDPVISIKNLKKEFQTVQKESGLFGAVKAFFQPVYKKTKAVDGISLTIERGEVVAFIGPNGAGKSTTLKILTGILYQSSGDVRVLDFTPSKERKKLAYKLGAVFGQKSQLWYHLPPQETYDLFSKIYDLPKAVYEKRLKKLVKIFDVKAFLKTPVRKLSLGQRMRCELVAALLHNPEVLLLDEPTIGLDLLSKKSLRETIIKLNREENITVLLTSHDLDDVERVCDRVVVINHGKIIYDDSLETLKQSYVKKKRVEVILDVMQEKHMWRKGVTFISQKGYKAVYEIDLGVVKTKQFINLLFKFYKSIGDINISEPTVEEIIEAIYKK